MQQVLLVVQVLVAVGLIAIVLLQQGRGADAGAAFGSGGSGTLFGARGPATLLTRTTAVLAAVFFVNSIALSYIATQTVDRRSVVERFEQQAGPGVDDALAELDGRRPGGHAVGGILRASDTTQRSSENLSARNAPGSLPASSGQTSPRMPK